MFNILKSLIINNLHWNFWFSYSEKVIGVEAGWTFFRFSTKMP